MPKFENIQDYLMRVHCMVKRTDLQVIQIVKKHQKDKGMVSEDFKPTKAGLGMCRSDYWQALHEQFVSDSDKGLRGFREHR